MPGSEAHFVTLRKEGVTPGTPIVIRDQESVDILARIEQEAQKVRQGIELIVDQELQAETTG